jgi:1-acyl-sn-glycerol-3-phosphate acyltransferase
MGALGETVRGASASAAWVCGAPFVNARVTRSAKSPQQARAMIAAHFGRFLDACRIRVQIGGSPPAAGTGCVLCYNETSFADVAAFCTVMWTHVDRAAAADLYAYVPFGRSSARKAAIELVPRGDRVATGQILDRMVQAVRSGERVAWGGEGRLSGRDGVARFKLGASLIAIRSQAPIIPVAYFGGHQALPLRSVRARPGTIQVEFGAPIPTAGLTEDDARSLADHTQSTVAGMYERLRAGVAAKS